MKIKLTALSAMLLALSVTQVQASHTQGDGPQAPSVMGNNLGETSEGGVTFWVDAKKLHGYAYYPTAVASTAWANPTALTWGNAGIGRDATVGGITPTTATSNPAVVGATIHGLGGGKANTSAIIAFNGLGALNNTANLLALKAAQTTANAAGGSCTAATEATTSYAPAASSVCLSGYYLANLEETMTALTYACANGLAISGITSGVTNIWTSNTTVATPSQAQALVYTCSAAGVASFAVTDTAMSVAYVGLAVRAF